MKARISVCRSITVSPEDLWADLADIASHQEWMADAERITFRTQQRRGIGTVFECRTRLGPIAVTDVLEVTEWEPAVAMGIVHRGAVSGTGRFTLHEAGDRRTHFCWTEDLRFPWWLGGVVGAWLGRPVFRLIWKRNITRLKQRVES